MNTPDGEIVRRGVIGVILREERFLVIRRSASVIAPLKFCFPGGGIEAGESEPQALVRELQEELSVAITPIRLIWNSVTTWRHALSWWLADLPQSAIPYPNPLEVESVHWKTADELLVLEDLLPSNRVFLQSLREGEIQL